jgi:hypothetical protein
VANRETPDPFPELRRMSTHEVAQWTAGWREGTANRILGELEIKRRLDRGNTVRGWVAIGISLAALAVSFFSVYLKRGPY